MALFTIPDGTGFQMNYEIQEGLAPENTLFIHGNLASNRWWYPAEEVWRREAKGKNWSGSLIYAEFRGCGKSSAPLHESHVDMHRFADDFISLVKYLDKGPMHLVGHSTGALIVALMMAKEPGLFKKAVLLDPVGAKGVKFDNSMIAAFEQMKQNKSIVAAVMNGTIYNNNPESDFFRHVVVEDAFRAVKTVGHLVLKALDGLDIQKQVSTIRCPSLVLHGEHDLLLARQDSENLATLMAAQFAVVPQQGHCMNVENPVEFVRRVKEFLF